MTIGTFFTSYCTVWLFFGPWSQALEKSLQEAREGWKDGKGGTLRFRFEPSLEKEPKFYNMPWPKEPEKQPPPPVQSI